MILAAGQVTPQAEEQAATINYNYRWSRISFWLDWLLNGYSLGSIGLLKPLTFVVGYDPVLVANLNEYTMTPYYWTGSAWSKASVIVTNRNVDANCITFTVDRIVGELSFFARPKLLYLPALHAGTD